jgi:ribose-phosphate pyrophosphokinase
MKPLVFAMSGDAALAQRLALALPAELGELELHQFPDGETCPRFATPVAGRDVMFACSLDQPNAKLMPLYLAACVARELGARSVGLVLPYLPYMRQDTRFSAGEGITSAHAARLLSSCCDWLVTVDPHLHRHHALSDIYTVATRVVQAAPAIAQWVVQEVHRPLLVGPDSESEQWVAQVAALADCPYTVLQKKRSGDRTVEVSMPDLSAWHGMTPVLVDDIVSTARTMIAAAQQIESAHMAPPVCIAVHPLFVAGAYAALHRTGIEHIVSCNTIAHSSNKIDITPWLAVTIASLLHELRARI